MGVVQELEESKADTMRARSYDDVASRFAMGQISYIDAILELRRRYCDAWNRYERQYFKDARRKKMEVES
jgi:hypothetical protein